MTCAEHLRFVESLLASGYPTDEVYPEYRAAVAKLPEPERSQTLAWLKQHWPHVVHP